MAIPPAAAERLAARARQLVGRTGCGLCGVETIREALRPVRPATTQSQIDIEAMWRVEAALSARQQLNQATGSIHAAAWATRAGEIEVVREDVAATTRWTRCWARWRTPAECMVTGQGARPDAPLAIARLPTAARPSSGCSHDRVPVHGS
ncbi:MAG: formate dehydrogenase accessory sulfurtransferase FdhD [Longimicrobiales bacterium]